MTFLFAGLLGMNRAFAGERENDGLQGLKLAPISWGAIYLGKMLANLCFMLLVESVILFCFALFFNFNLLPRLGLDVWYHAAGYARLCVDRHHPGCDFDEHAHERRDAAASSSCPSPCLSLLEPWNRPPRSSRIRPGEALGFWVKFLVAFNIIFITLPLMMFEYVLEE